MDIPKVLSASDEISRLYYNPKFGFVSASKFIKKLKDNNISFNKDEVEEFLKKQELTQVYKKPIVRDYLRITAPPKTFQTDIMMIDDYYRFNKGYKKLLIFIDILTRKAFIYPLKKKNSDEILSAFKQFINEVGNVFGIQGDDEFNKDYVKDELKKYNISLHTNIAKEDHIIKGNKLGIIDRFVRTFRNFLKKYMFVNKTIVWVDVYKDLLENYNNTPMKSNFNLSPNQMFNDIVAQNRKRINDMKYNQRIMSKRNLNVDDKVRIINTNKKKFGKESQNFSNEIYTISDIDVNKYKVQDNEGNIKQRNFKYYELVKIPEGTVINKNEIPSEQVEFNKNLQKAKKIRRENKILNTNNIEDYIELIEKNKQNDNTKYNLRERKPINYKV